MNRFAPLLTLRTASLVSLLAAATALYAQWPDYPTRGVPMKDGKPDLEAAAPRTADGKVDFTGIWENRAGPGPGGPGAGKGKGGPPPGGLPPDGLPPGGPPPSGPGAFKGKGPPPGGFPPGGPPPGVGAAKGKGKALDPNQPPMATFFDIGAGFPNGLPLRPWAKELKAERMANNSKDNPDAHCLPMGLMQYHLHPQPRKMIQTKDLLVILYEANAGIRQIYLDGRPLPPKDVDPWWFGYSVGHWEGDTLVVETTHWRDLGWLDVNGTPLTSEGKTIERFRRPNYGNLDIDVTIDDPKAYTAPFTVRVAQQILLNQEMIEFVCGENEQDAPHLVGDKAAGTK